MKLTTRGSINMRSAMLELHLDYDGMAGLIDMTRREVLELCLREDCVPDEKQQKVKELLNIRLTATERRPAEDVLIELMHYVHTNGRMLVDDAVRMFKLNAKQLMIAQQVYNWIYLGQLKVPGFYGLKWIVAVTAKGYVKLGLTPNDVSLPAGQPVNGKLFGEEHNEVAAELVKRIDVLRRGLDNLETLQQMLVSGSSPSTVAELMRVTDHRTEEQLNELESPAATPQITYEQTR